jgi:beta-galactosidase/beta-glucuronidase
MADYRLGSEHFLKLCDKYGLEIMEEVVTEYRGEHPELKPNDGRNGNLEA